MDPEKHGWIKNRVEISRYMRGYVSISTSRFLRMMIKTGPLVMSLNLLKTN